MSENVPAGLRYLNPPGKFKRKVEKKSFFYLFIFYFIFWLGLTDLKKIAPGINLSDENGFQPTVHLGICLRVCSFWPFSAQRNIGRRWWYNCHCSWFFTFWLFWGPWPPPPPRHAYPVKFFFSRKCYPWIIVVGGIWQFMYLKLLNPELLGNLW